RSHPLRLRDRLIAYLPRYAPYVARIAPDFVSDNPMLAGLQERLLGFSARRPLPRWHPRPFNPRRDTPGAPANPRGEAVLLVDTFTTWFEPENARAALRVLHAGDYTVHLPQPDDGRPLC